MTHFLSHDLTMCILLSYIIPWQCAWLLSYLLPWVCAWLLQTLLYDNTHYSSPILLLDNVHDTSHILLHDKVHDFSLVPCQANVHDSPLPQPADDPVYMIRINYCRKQKWLIAISWHCCTLLQGCFSKGRKEGKGGQSGVFKFLAREKSFSVLYCNLFFE
jgi:predicted Rdx family selenoprotein